MSVQTEEDYISYLRNERYLYAWSLMKYADCTLWDAKEEAMAFYPSEPTSE